MVNKFNCGAARVITPNEKLIKSKANNPDKAMLNTDEKIKDENPEFQTVQIIFNSNGGVDRVYYYNPYLDANYVGEFEDPEDFPDTEKKFKFGFIDSRIPNGPLFFYVSEYEIEPLPNDGVLDSPANLWVTLNNSTGATNVASNTVTTNPNALLGARIEYARGMAKEFQSAAQ